MSKDSILVMISGAKEGGGFRDNYTRLKFLSQNYKISIISSKPSKDFLDKHFPKIKKFYTPYLKIPFLDDFLAILMLRRIQNKFNFKHFFVFSAPAPQPLVCFSRINPIWYNNLYPLQHIKPYNLRLRDLIYSVRTVLYFPFWLITFFSCKKIICSAVLTKNFFLDLGIPENKVISIDPGVDLTLFKNNNYKGNLDKDILNLKKQGHLIVFYGGNVNRSRGSDLFLECSKLFKKRKVKATFVIVGCDNFNLSIMEKYVRKHEISKYIKLNGPVSMNSIPEYIKISDVGISLLSNIKAFKYSQPQKILEFFAMGTPVIANDLPTHRLYIEDNITGFLTDYDPYSICDKIEHLSKNKLKLKALSHNCLKKSEKYDIVNSLREFDNVISTYLGDS